jgi:hypothetical protein
VTVKALRDKTGEGGVTVKAEQKNRELKLYSQKTSRRARGDAEGEKMRKEKGEMRNAKRDLLIFLIPHSSFLFFSPSAPLREEMGGKLFFVKAGRWYPGRGRCTY